MSEKQEAGAAGREIRRWTRRKYSAGAKIRILLEGRGEKRALPSCAGGGHQSEPLLQPEPLNGYTAGPLAAMLVARGLDFLSP